jgi:hypothetical protein
VQIPQRFITVNGLSPIAAGIRLIPFEVLAPVGACIAAILMDKPKVPPSHIFLAGAVLQTVGITLWSTVVPSDIKIAASQYAFQVITGLGVGFVNSALILFVPYAMDKQDLGKSEEAAFYNVLIRVSNWELSHIPISLSWRIGGHCHRHFHHHALSS